MKLPQPHLRSALLHAALLTTAASLPALHAATQTYTDGSAANVWDLATLNWDSSAAAWVSDGDAVFGGTGETVDLDAAVSAGSVTFNANGYVLADTGTGGSLTLTGAKTITTAPGVSATISDIMPGTAGLTKAGTGTLVLSGANTYTGTTTVSDGVLEVSAKGTGNAAYVVSATGTLRFGYAVGNSYTHGVTVNGAGVAATTGLYLQGGRNINFQNNGGITLATAPTTVRTYGTGAAILSGYDTNGTHLTVPAVTSGSVFDSTVNITGGSFGYVMNITAGANTATGDMTINGLLTGDKTWRKVGTGSLLLTGASTNTANSSMDIRNGSVILSGGTNRLGVVAPVILGNGTTSGKLVLDGIAQTISNLSAVGTGTANMVVGKSATLSTLTVNYVGAGQTFSGVLGGVGTNENNLAFGKSGVGTFTLSGANTYTGGTTVTGGALALGSAGAVGSSGTIALKGGKLQFTASNTTDYSASGRLKIDDDLTGTLDTNGLDVTLSAPISGGALGTGILGKAGAGTLILTGSQTLTGGTVVSAGVLALDYSTADSSKLADAGTLTLAGGTLRLSGGSHAEVVAGTLVTGVATLERSSGTATIQLGEITRTGSATLAIAANGIARTTLGNDISGKLPAWITVAGQPATNDGSGNIIAYSGFVDVVRLGGKIPNNPLANVRVVNGGSTGTVTPLTSGLTGISTLLQNASAGPATVTLGGSDTLRLGESGALIVPATSGALTIQGDGILSAGGADETSGEIAVSAEAPVTIASSILDNGSTGLVTLTKAGSSSLTLAASNGHSGGTELNGGTLNLNHDQSLGLGSFTINGGSLDNTSGGLVAVVDAIAQTWNADINFTGTNDLLFTAGGVTMTANRTVTVQNSTLEVRALAGAYGLTKEGPGTFTVGSGSWNGATTVNAGTMEVLARSADGAFTVAPGATLKLGYTTGGGYAATNLKLNGAGTAATTGLYLKGGSTYNGAGAIQLLTAPTTIRQYGTGLAGIGQFDINADALITVAASSGSEIDANIELISRGYGMSVNIASGAANATGDLVVNGRLNADVLGFYKRGAGSVRLNSAATALNKGVKIQGGSVIAGAANVLGENAELPISSGAKLVMNGFSQAAGTLSGAGAVSNGSATPATLTIKQGSDQTFSGVLGGATADDRNFALAKSGTFKLTLTAANTYTGSTTVSEGTLALSSAYLSDSADVLLGAAAVLELNSATSDTIDELFVDGVAQSAGVYGAIGSGAQYEKAYITGSGTLTVTTGGGNAYSDWATANGIPGEGGTVDSDKDGIPNGIEFVIGGDPSGPGSDSNALLPTVSLDATYMTIVYRRADASVSYNPRVQYSTTLGSGTWTNAVNAQPGATPVVITEDNEFFGTGIDRVTVKVPRALAAPGSKLFGRLTVDVP